MMSISRTLVRSTPVFVSSLTHKLCIFDLFPFSKLISTCSIDQNQPSFQVSYLINSCGLSPESALKSSKLVKFETPEKPDSVLAFFKNHGFSKTQVSKLIKRFPQLITTPNPEKSILPKLQFFYSKGISVPHLAKILSNHPTVLARSLENHLIPTYDFITKFLQSEDKIINTIKRCPRILAYDFNLHVMPIIDICRNYGVPESNITMWLVYQPGMFMTSSEKFTEIIEEVKKMGFDRSKVSFFVAIHALRSVSKSTWERKVEVYKRWGLSHEEVLHTFRKYPWCMTHSEQNICAKMDFFVNKMGWDPSVIAQRALYIGFSLEKRIIPRCSVLVELLSRGLITKKYRVTPLLESTEKIFLQKYVNRYEDEAPHLLKIYHEKLGGAKKREAIGP